MRKGTWGLPFTFGRIKLPHQPTKETKTMSDNIIQLNEDLIKHDLNPQWNFTLAILH